MQARSLDALAGEFHDRLKSIKDRTALESGARYPWRTLPAMQMMEREMGVDLDALLTMIGSDPVLDLGCGDGDTAFFLESLGVRVDAVDHAPTNYNRMQGVRALRQGLGSNIGIHAADVDTRPNLPASNYGLAIMLGVLYHLKNPYLVLETLARGSRHLYMSTRIASLTPDHKLNFGASPMAYLVDDRELNDDPTNFWIFSEVALERVLRRSGWRVLKSFTRGSAVAADPLSPEGDARIYILAESVAARDTGLRLERGWHELEYGASRWTERRFSVSLRVPNALTPATLRFLFQLPEVLLSLRPRIALWASVNGSRLPAAEFARAGEHEYWATLPSLPAGRVEIDFELDATASIGIDERELGVQVYFNGPPPVQLK